MFLQSLAATATAEVPINVPSAIKDVLRRGSEATVVGGARWQRQLRQQESQKNRDSNDDSSTTETKCLHCSFITAWLGRVSCGQLTLFGSTDLVFQSL